jgi:hypothetical protein
VPELLSEAERLYAIAPERFVDERKALAKKLREEGRNADATTVEALRKPTAVVFAVNRAARDRPKPARAAADAAQRVKATQLGGDQDEFQHALRELDDALGLLADVALAQLSPPGKKGANDSMRRRVRVLLRSAAAVPGRQRRTAAARPSGGSTPAGASAGVLGAARNCGRL